MIIEIKLHRVELLHQGTGGELILKVEPKQPGDQRPALEVITRFKVSSPSRDVLKLDVSSTDLSGKIHTRRR